MRTFTRPRSILALTALMLTLGLGAFAASWIASPPPFSYSLAVLAMSAVLSENYALTIPSGSISLAFPLCIAALVLHGPAGGAIVALVSSVNIEDFRLRIPLTSMAYNVGQLLLLTIAGGWVFEVVALASVSSLEVPAGAYSWVRTLLAIAAMALICGLGNIALVNLGAWVAYGDSIRSRFAETSWVMPSQVALAFVGYLIALVLNISILGFFLFVFPLVVARQIHVNYEKARVGYIDTIRSLVGAVEAKDPYTRGHSERVSESCVAMGKVIGIDSRQLQDLEYAALLHDVGKLAIPQEILTKPGKLTDRQYCTVQEHSSRGAEMVSRITALRALAQPVRHHHERWDGTGYPDNLAGDAIPLMARVLCVADSYDAMTSARSYRRALSSREAATELVRCAGTQFDPSVVTHFLSEVLSGEIAGPGNSVSEILEAHMRGRST